MNIPLSQNVVSNSLCPICHEHMGTADNPKTHTSSCPFSIRTQFNRPARRCLEALVRRNDELRKRDEVVSRLEKQAKDATTLALHLVGLAVKISQFHSERRLDARTVSRLLIRVRETTDDLNKNQTLSPESRLNLDEIETTLKKVE